jgi:hypothetical protein
MIEEEEEKHQQEIKEKIKDFSSLLASIENLEDKKKKLWTEIYENAITDRQNAYMLFVKLSNIIENKSTEFAVHGKTMTSFIERMGKANDQLIKLADLIASADQKNDNYNPDDLYEKMKKN